MTETVFKTAKSSIAVFRQMIDQANKEHETVLKNLKNNYIGDMFVKMKDNENSEHRKRTDTLRNAAYNEICGNIKAVREQISAKSRVNHIAELAKAAGVPCETVVAQSTKPHEEIVRAANQYQCDCIFMASNGRKGLNKLFIGSETQKVLTTADVPVMVYR